jgi:hypothetical protein
MDLPNILSLVTTKSQQIDALDLIESLLSDLYKNKDKIKTQNQDAIIKSPLHQEILKTIELKKMDFEMIKEDAKSEKLEKKSKKSSFFCIISMSLSLDLCSYALSF